MDLSDVQPTPRPMKLKSKRWKLWLILLTLFGLSYSQDLRIPVRGASAKDWNPQSFWYEPWGSSGVHKGIDIFAAKGTAVIAPCAGWIIRRGEGPKSGKTVLLLSPNLRLHYMGHLDSVDSAASGWVPAGQILGMVGNTGNAAGKPPHLHYAIATLLPHPWRIRLVPQGWKHMFFLDPNDWLPGS